MAIVQGLIFGTGFGLIQGLLQRSLSYGVVSGLFFGPVMYLVFLRAAAANPHMAELTLRQRREVIASIRRGRPVHDPALAAATVVHARQVQDRARGGRWGLVLVWIFLTVSVVGLGLALALDSALGAIGAGFSLAVWTVILLVGPALERRTMANARAAQQAAQRLVPPS
ncbi:MAG TPA: hypothetical protein VGV63_01125 [Acidimicrobiales bacterium]|nr:hypothetical protein [Acidimicrobiales bacterium]